MTTIDEVLRRVRAKGPFESWGHTGSVQRQEEDSSVMRASMCLRDAITCVYEMDKVVSSGPDRAAALPQLVGVLRHLASAMDQIGQSEASGALSEVGDYLDEIVSGDEM